MCIFYALAIGEMTKILFILLTSLASTISYSAEQSIFANGGLRALDGKFWYFFVSYGDNRGEFRSSLLHEYGSGILDYPPARPQRLSEPPRPPSRIVFDYEYYFVVSREKGGNQNYYHFNEQVPPFARLLDSLAKTYHPWGPDIEETRQPNLLIEDERVYSIVIPLDGDRMSRDNLLNMLARSSGCEIGLAERSGFERLVVGSCNH